LLQIVNRNHCESDFLGPLAALTAIIFGSAVAISFGLCAVLVIFWVIRGDSDQVGVEIGLLPIYCLVFLALAGVSGAAIFSLAKNLYWRWRAQAGMWVSLVALAVLVWLR
jgi:hypothetical protein